MDPGEFVRQRKSDWEELDRLCHILGRRRPTAEMVCRLSELYRAVCSDLACAESQQLAPELLDLLHRLVGHAHHVLYRHPQSLPREWLRTLFVLVPARVVRDKAFWLSFAVFWGLFFATLILARQSEAFAVAVVGEDTLAMMDEMYSSVSFSEEMASPFKVGFYIYNNMTVALECFALGILFVLPGLTILVFNAVFLGTIFGHMTVAAQADTFFQFVTGHGPFELTAICLSAGCGMRLGFALLQPGELTRLASLRRATRQVAPILVMCGAFVVIAAVIEGTISPSAASYETKRLVAGVSLAAILAYFATGVITRETDGGLDADAGGHS